MARSIAAPASRRAPSRRSREAPAVLRPLRAGAQRIRAWFAFVWKRRRLRITLLAVVVALPLLGGGWLLLRRSPLVSVEHVKISGVHGPNARALDAALSSTARRMSTLDVHPAALLAAVSSFRVVRQVKAYPSFPHGLRIEVVEQLPVAALSLASSSGAQAGARTAVAADGVVLGPALLSSSLPSVSAPVEPAAGERVRDPGVLATLSVLGAAPAPLARMVERAYTGPKGLTIAMRGGLLAYFGNAARPHAKWLSLARVLADPSSAGASYVDVRVPARPAAGFPAGVSPPGASEAAGTSEPASGSESPVASLAAGLSASGGEASAPSEEATGNPSAGGGASSETGASSSQAPAASGVEPGAGTQPEGASGEAPAGG